MSEPTAVNPHWMADAHRKIIADMSGPLGVQMGLTCAVHSHPEWVPMERHHVWPLGMGGPDRDVNKITVCANGHYAIHAFLDLLIDHSGEVPWETARHFGKKVRDFAIRGWVQAGSPTNEG